MHSLDLLVFGALYHQACRKCFGYPLEQPLTETESKLLHNRIFEQTGLTVGWKSLKNYSFFLLSDAQAKEENPSISTLDTLARYVKDAPYTSEVERKKQGDLYACWYQWKDDYLRKDAGRAASEKEAANTGRRATSEREATGYEPRAKSRMPENAEKNPARTLRTGLILAGLGIAVIILTMVFRSRAPESFTEDFHHLRDDSLKVDGWWVRDKDPEFWNRRQEKAGVLSLFTLKGDNWPDSTHTPVIRNLLLHRLPCDCWTQEVHVDGFVPGQNWQQAGVLLTEDTGLTGRSIRISVGYNDYMGGGPRDREVLVQAITYPGGVVSKPEEIVHVPLFNADSLDKNPLLARNLDHSALRIEKQGNRFRILYSGGPFRNSSFRELCSRELDISPRYVGIFALKGFVDSSAVVPALFSYYSLRCERCGP